MFAFSPFVIGVTGHRNLADDDLARARSEVAAFFQGIRRLLPDTELTVMLGMAAGGDLVVAETALALGIRVEAMLPMPLADFVADFDERNRRLLTELLAHPGLRRVELSPTPGRVGPAVSVDPAWRQSAYRNLADVLIRKSNLMLALWDGKASLRPGGTTETVLRCLRVRTDEAGDGSRLEFTAGDPRTDTESTFVYWLPIAPGGNDADVAAASPCFLTGFGDTILKFGSTPPDSLRRRIEEFNDYNRDYRWLAADARAVASESLLAGVPTDLLGEDGERLAQIDSEYRKADSLALRFQKRSDGLFGVFAIFAFLVGCLYLAYDKLGENPEILLAYLMVLVGGLVLYRLLYAKVWFVKHLRYRALAETLRVTFYLCLSGADGNVDAAEVLGLSGIEQFEGFGSIVFVLKNVAAVNAGRCAHLDPRRCEYVRDAWVDDQHRYFSRKVKKLEQKSLQVAQWQSAVVAITIGVLLVRLLFSQAIGNTYVVPGVPLKNLLMLVAGVTALFLGAWKLHQGKMATRELIWQYKNQLVHFSRSSAELGRTGTPERRIEVLVKLGKRSLMESYLWTIHRYHREHAPPIGA